MSGETMTWAQLLGEKGDSLTPEQRIENWTGFFSTADADMRDYWNGCDGCTNCAHLRTEARHGISVPWCSLQELPASFNPILTMRMSLVGMACMGAGREPVDENGQAIMELSTTESGELPF